MAIERIYITRGNLIDIVLVSDGDVPSLSSVTRMTLVVGSVTLDSAIHSGVFDWSKTLTADEAEKIAGAETGDSKLVLNLGGQAIAAGDYEARLTVYDPTYTEGLNWGDIPLTVEKVTAPTATTGPGCIVPPQVEPVLMDELKGHLSLDGADYDDILEALLVSAREHAEDVTWRKFMTQTWVVCLSEWPLEDNIELPYGNLQSVTSVKWKDQDGTETTLTPVTDYIVEKNGDQRGRIVLPYGVSWPTGTLYPSNPITITFVCGWAAVADVPKKIRLAIKMIAADLFNNRGDRVTGTIVTENRTAASFLASLKLW